MTNTQIGNVNKGFNYEWANTFELQDKDRLDIEIFMDSIFNILHAKFNSTNICDSLNKYFFFTGIDFDDLFSAKPHLERSFINVKELEESLSDEKIEIELKEIKFSRDMSINITMLLYVDNYVLTVVQSNKKVSISSVNGDK